MGNKITNRLAHAWNAFFNRDPTNYHPSGYGYSKNPDRPILSRSNGRTIVTSIYNRIAIDASAINIRHCKVDSDGRFLEEKDSGLNRCLSLEANIDQSCHSFIRDVVLTALDKGAAAIVPVEISDDDELMTNANNIKSLRVGEIIEWYPTRIKVRVYNEFKGIREDIVLPKKIVGVVENPLYPVVNENNSSLQRLVRKLSLLDASDERAGSGKLDLIIQLPYSTRATTRQAQAQNRRSEITDQLINSEYGIAYIDANEKVVQLNRSVENNLLKQIEYLTNLVYSQLSMTDSVMNGTADEATMLNYITRTVEPFVIAIVDELKRKYLSQTAMTQGQSIEYFNDPFKLVPVSQLAEIADKFTRNEILTSNEVRQLIGIKPSKDPKADELRNSNIRQVGEKIVTDNSQTNNKPNIEEGDEKSQNG